MNYLAHSYLSFNVPEIIVGNYIADSVNGNNFLHYPKKIIDGIKLHRKIDSFTDSHTVYLSSKHKFSSEFDKYSGIIMDIFYDYFLAKNFNQFCKIPLQDYSAQIYNTLYPYLEIMPIHAQKFYGYMTKNNILYNYSDLKNIETVLTHLSNRLKYKIELQKSIPHLQKHYLEIENEFFIFFNELINYCKQQPELQ